MALAGDVATWSSVAVAVSGERSRRALRWAADKLIPVARRVLLLHVIPSLAAIPEPSGRLVSIDQVSSQAAEMYEDDRKAKALQEILPFKKMCRTTKEVEVFVFDGDNTADVLLRYVSESGIDNLVLGGSSWTWFRRILRRPDVATNVLKSAPISCNIFVVSRQSLMVKMANQSAIDGPCITKVRLKTFSRKDSRGSKDGDASMIGGGISPVSSSTSRRKERQKRRYLSNVFLESKAFDKHDFLGSFKDKPLIVLQSRSLRSQCQDPDDVEKLRQELQNTRAMYNQACEDLVHARQKVQILSSEFSEETRKVQDALLREELLKRIAAEEKAKHLEAVKEVNDARQMLAKEALGRHKAETDAVKASSEKVRMVDALMSSDKRYRRYSKNEIEVATDNFSVTKKIGEGGYGNVYKAILDHTPVAVKVLREDAFERKEEFLREVEVLSQLHHPHMLLLLGACPESGCLVYEYMENGSLEDRLFCREGTRPLPWFIRFRIIFEVACGLSFLHGSKPEPIVHRDLKPGNILLDRNYVSKIGDVGLAKLVTHVVPDGITEYKETVLAGTLYYMDPEYQRTGTLRPKSDVYAFGIIILQLLTAKPPMGLTTIVENAIKGGSFANILDKSISDWPLVESEKLAQISLKCSRLRCRDRPDLESEVIPELEELSRMADIFSKSRQSQSNAPAHFFCPILQVLMDNPYIAADGFSYEYRAIKAWLEKHRISPVTRLKLQHTAIIPNHSLHSAIQAWKSELTVSSTGR